MNAASGRKRASNGATRLRLHSVGATNPLLGVRGRWLQGEQHRHCEGRGPFVAVHHGRSTCSLITLHSMRLKIKLFLPDRGFTSNLAAISRETAIFHLAQLLHWRCDPDHKKSAFRCDGHHKKALFIDLPTDIGATDVEARSELPTRDDPQWEDRRRFDPLFCTMIRPH